VRTFFGKNVPGPGWKVEVAESESVFLQRVWFLWNIEEFIRYGSGLDDEKRPFELHSKNLAS
jgi:hypothetical protein